MPTTYTNGLKLPDLGSIDWFNAYKNNIDILDPIVGTVNGVATTYAPISHNHDASEITSGTIDIARLPPAALERLHTVADQTARYALTTSTVQLGDTVKQLDTGIMYLVVDTTKLNSADGYTEYSAGTATKAIADADGNTISSTYGKLAGSQTWTGGNTFSKDNLGVQTAYALGTLPQAESALALFKGLTADSNFVTGMYFYQSPTKGTGLRLTIRNKWDNNGYSTTGTTRNAHLEFLQSINKTAYLQWEGYVNNGLYPLTNSTYTLGTSSYRWSSVYADSYYYGTTAFTDKFVTTDTSQTISGLKYFSSNILHKTPQTIDVSTNPAEVITGKGLQFVDNAQYWGDITPQWTTDGTFRIRIAMTNYDTAGTSTGWFCPIVLDLAKNGSKVDIWSTHLNSNLGTSTNKFKTLNGVNPGALSLPDASNAVALDITNVSMDGTYTYLSVSVNGWLYVALKDTTCKTDGELTFYIGDSGTSSAYAKWATNFVCSTDGYVRCFIPVLANSRIRIRVNPNGGSPTGLTMTIYPCLGNV